MNINHLIESQILSISDLVRSTILYCCKSNKIFLEQEDDLVNTCGDIYKPNYSKGECRREELADALVSSEKSLEIITEALDSLWYVGQAFWLQYEGYNDQEIAERLGKSNGAIRTRKSNARKKLARDPQIISLCREFGIRISA